MKKTLLYNEAYEKLEELVEQLEQGDIQLDQLTETVKQAHELIEFCENKLRKIEDDINEVTKPSSKKKKKE
jgi:exodeoxyribonuclease VII small subunit